MSKVDYRNVEYAADRCGGQAAIGGTRIRVATILACYRLGMSVEKIVSQYSMLKPSDIHDGLAFAYEHLAEIESNLAADDEEAVKASIPTMRDQ